MSTEVRLFPQLSALLPISAVYCFAGFPAGGGHGTEHRRDRKGRRENPVGWVPKFMLQVQHELGRGDRPRAWRGFLFGE